MLIIETKFNTRLIIVFIIYMWPGFGVFAARNFETGEFLLEYRGDLVDPAVSGEVEDQCYIYYFQCGSKKYRLVHGNVNFLAFCPINKF